MKTPSRALLLLASGLLGALVAGCADPRSGSASTDPSPVPAATEMTDRKEPTPMSASTPSEDATTPTDLETATLGAGCYWCIEAVLEQLDGVKKVTSGFMGGHVDDPSYAAVCTGATGHAEVVQVEFDPTVLPYADLLEWFWRAHDPTTLNRQGADVGTQYRSAIFTHSNEQKEIAEKSKTAAADAFADPIVTEITPATKFWPAKAEHQDFYRNNKGHGYCRMVIAPKLRKLELEE